MANAAAGKKHLMQYFLRGLETWWTSLRKMESVMHSGTSEAILAFLTQDVPMLIILTGTDINWIVNCLIF